MDREQEGQAGTGLGDFEVKEQDRWLPIANGWCCFVLYPSACVFVFLPRPCDDNLLYGRGHLICSTLALQSCVSACRQERCLTPLCESECATLHLLFSQPHLIRSCSSSSQAMICIAALPCADWCGTWTTRSTLAILLFSETVAASFDHACGPGSQTSTVVPPSWRALVALVVRFCFSYVRC